MPIRHAELHLTEIKIDGQPYWRVTLPKAGGGRIRRAFKNKNEAKVFLDQSRINLRRSGAEGVALSPLQLEQALAADELLRPFGISVLDAAKRVVDLMLASSKSVPVSEAFEALLEDMRVNGKSKVHINDTTVRLGRFATDFSDVQMSDVRTDQIAKWIQSRKTGAVDRNKHRTLISGLFAFAIGRGWAQSNPVKAVSVAKVIQGEIGILTPDEMASILTNADQRTVAYWAIGAFCGLRSSELERLDWTDVNGEYVKVKGSNAKSARRRLIRISDNLTAWLQPYRQASGSIVPLNLRKLLDDDCIRAGVTDWPPNALRHSFASYSIALHKDAGRTALDLGHASAGIVFSNYRELVTESDAKRWFSIMPATA